VTPAAEVPDEVVVGLDVGTTGVKAVAFGLPPPWRRVAIREYPLLQPQPGWQVQDPQAIVDATAAALGECAAAAAGARVVAIALSTAMHGLIGVDAELRPLTPLITWADARAHGEAKQLRASGRATRLHRRGGTPVHSMTPLAKLMWLHPTPAAG
jgi:gluconokinase